MITQIDKGFWKTWVYPTSNLGDLGKDMALI
jgi:hypothetical protein